MQLSRGLLLLFALNGIAMGLAWSVQAPFLRSLGYTGTMYGILGGLSVVSGALSTIVAGVLSDVLGSRRVMASGLLAWTVSSLLVSRGTWEHVVAGYLIAGVASGFYWTSSRALVSRLGSDDRLHYTLSYTAAAGSLGGAFGSILGWAPVYASNLLGVPLVDAYRYAILAAGLFTLAGLPLLRGIVEYKSDSGISRGLDGVRGLSRYFLGLVLFEALIGFGAAMSIHNIDYYFTKKYNVTSGELGSVFALQQLAMALLMIRLPRLSDRIGGPLRLYLIVTSSSIPLLIGMTLTNSYLIASTLYLIRSILMNVANPLYEAFALSLVGKERRGVASSMLSLAWTLPASAGRAFGGFLMDVDLELPLRITAVLYSVSLAGYAYIGRKTGRF